MSNNRQRVSIPVLGIDTSTTDTQIKDGAMQELHNLRYSGGAWRDIKPFLEKNRAQLLKTPNLIIVSPDGTVTAQYPIARPLIVVTATWTDADGVHATTSTTSIPQGATTAQIDVKYDILTGVSISSPAGDDQYAYYSQFDETPKVAIDNAIAPNKIVGVYQHPADEKDIYLIVAKEDYEEGASIYRVQIKEGKASVLQSLGFWSGNFNISHFGNTLIIFDAIYQKIDYFYLSNGKYQSFTIPEPPIVKQSNILSLGGKAAVNSVVKNVSRITSIYGTDLYNNAEQKLLISTSHDNGCFWGEICYFAAFRMISGELISPGALSISASEPMASGETSYIGADNLEPTLMQRPSLYYDPLGLRGEKENMWIVSWYPDETTFPINPFNFAISPYISISIPDGISKDMIRSVDIYSTRVFPIWDIKKLKSFCDEAKLKIDAGEASSSTPVELSDNFSSLFADNKLPEQPFYLMKTIPLSEFSDEGVFSMYITSDLLENIEQKTAYQSIDAHQIFFRDGKEYNNRIHSSSAITTKLFKGFSNSWVAEGGNSQSTSITELAIENRTYYAIAEKSADIATDMISNKILSYPDYRAKNIYNNSNSFALKEALENNFAYAVNMQSKGNAKDFYNSTEDIEVSYVKYSARFSDIKEKNDFNESDSRDKSTYTRTNVMRVSAPNNPFVFPLANTYAIGTEENEIIAVNSAAIELSDTKIGEFPLYVFTKEGIWVMRLGSGDVLYDFDLPRFYDQAINPDTLAVNANLLYITSRGLHALHSSGTSLISEALNDQFNVPELDFWKTAHLTHQPKYEEVIVYNLDKNESGNAKWPNAYVFSLGNQTWSTRNWVSGSEKLFQTPSRDIVLIDDLFRVFDCNEEHRNEGYTSTIRLVSRPIKLGSMEFKRMETLIPRIEVDAAQPLRITIEASSDLVSWVTLREISTLTSNHTLTIRRTSCSARYFRITMEVDVTHNFALSGFDMEYYLRFLHRLR